MTLHVEPMGDKAASAGHRFSYVLAALDQTSVSSAVRLVANHMAAILAVPLREVHVVGRVPSAMDTRRLASRVARGELTTVPGNVAQVLPILIEADESPLAVLGMPTPEGLRPRRLHSTVLTVARRVSRPMLLVPRTLKRWSGPHHILVPLDGTSLTAFGASLAVSELHLGAVSTTPVHIFTAENAPPFWNHEPHAHAAWRQEFEARFIRGLMGGHVEVRAGPTRPSEHILQMLTEGGFDLTVLVWSRMTRGTQGRIVLELIARSPTPILLVPSGYGIPLGSTT